MSVKTIPTTFVVFKWVLIRSHFLFKQPDDINTWGEAALFKHKDIVIKLPLSAFIVKDF